MYNINYSGAGTGGGRRGVCVNHTRTWIFSHDHWLQSMRWVNKRACAGLSLAHLWWLVVTQPVFLCKKNFRHRVKLLEGNMFDWTCRQYFVTNSPLLLQSRTNYEKEWDSKSLSGVSNLRYHQVKPSWRLLSLFGKDCFTPKLALFESDMEVV